MYNLWTIFNTTALENKYLPESEYDSNGLLKKVTKENALKMQAIADPRLTIDTSYVEVNKGFNSKVTATLIANEKNEIGIVRGLAWTSVGGDTLQIEVNTMPGKGNTGFNRKSRRCYERVSTDCA